MVLDQSRAADVETRRQADPARPGQVGAPMPGRVIGVHVEEGAMVQEGDPLLTLEAMKMETVVRAPVAGEVHELCTDVGQQIQGGDLLVIVAQQS